MPSVALGEVSINPHTRYAEKRKTTQLFPQSLPSDDARFSQKRSRFSHPYPHCPHNQKTDFERVELGTAKALKLRVENITRDEHTLVLDKAPSDGSYFSLEADSFVIPPACNKYLVVHWAPPPTLEVSVDGRNMREQIKFKWNDKQKLAVTLLGCAVLPAAVAKVLLHTLHLLTPFIEHLTLTH
jgi:hypothetical protein